MNDTVPEELLRLLRCPKCRRPVAPSGAGLACSNPDCGLRYPVHDGIPVMLVEEADSPLRPVQEAVPGP